ncbi:MAG: ATP-binding protein [candidate division Zixibacteria bacterium]|nr:ATP-binding protein [candidate division Zixibacteria bacterium]
MEHVPQQEVTARLQGENPWWREPYEIPKNIAGWKPRPYLDLLYPLIKQESVNRAIVLMGPRRVGKTVMIHHAIGNLLKEGVKPANICYISIDHPIYDSRTLDDLLKMYSESTSVDYQKEKCFIFLDEIQYMRDWERYLKALVDRYPHIKFVASGSAAAALRMKSTESGAGRFTDFLLPPLAFHEYLLLLDRLDVVAPLHKKEGLSHATMDVRKLNRQFLKYINYGGYPEMVLSREIQQDPGRFIKSDIIDKVLLRDLPSLYGISNIPELNSLFTTLAYNTANEVSLMDLSTKSGIAKNTIKKYIEYLEAAFLIRVVHRVDKTAKKFKRANSFKVYLTNPSIRTALFVPTQSDDNSIGSMVETAIFSQWFHSEGSFHYARWKAGEVDIVMLDAGRQKASWAVEVKWSDRFYHNPRDAKNLIKFCHVHNLSHATVTTLSEFGSKTVDNVNLEFMPASFYCYILGRNIVEGKQAEMQESLL